MLIGRRVHPRPINTAQGLLKPPWEGSIGYITLTSLQYNSRVTVGGSSVECESTSIHPLHCNTTVISWWLHTSEGKCAAANHGSCALCSTLAPKLVFLTIIIKNFYQEKPQLGTPHHTQCSGVHHTIHSVVVYITHTCVMGPNKCSTWSLSRMGLGPFASSVRGFMYDWRRRR